MPVPLNIFGDSIKVIFLTLAVVFTGAAMGRCHGQSLFDHPGKNLRAEQNDSRSNADPATTGWTPPKTVVLTQQPKTHSETWTAPVIRPNQPYKLEDSEIQNLSDEVREQIGLATFEQPVAIPVRSTGTEIDRKDGSMIGSELKKAQSLSGPDSLSQPWSEASIKQPPSIKQPLVDAADESKRSPYEFQFPQFMTEQSESLTAPSGFGNSIKFALLIGALSLAPAIVLMTTCYIRVVVVLSLLKQAFGGQQLPPAQVITALSLFLTFLIMTPVWNELKVNAIDPYSEKKIDWNEAWERGVAPIRSFMIRQIELADNNDSVDVFYKYSHVATSTPPSDLSAVPLNVLIPAFMISELKVAFLLGFQIYLPFLVLDLIVSSVTVSMGMVMLPPQLISFPLKLILFVMVDGWNLVIGLLLQSFGGGP